MWQVYKMNRVVGEYDFVGTFNLLYPKYKKDTLSFIEKVNMHSIGLTYNNFSEFKRFVIGISNASK